MAGAGLATSTSQPVSASLIEKSFEELQAGIDNAHVNMVDTVRLSPTLPLELKQQKQQQPTSTTKTTLSKKKGAPQNLSPSQSAAYRKRLNVNQGKTPEQKKKLKCPRNFTKL
ncbi:hypothetical protein BGZ65_005524 [Modicella reniformis]|uniref:Uncharacterized protein n=1 Tax=Modicella reniformis TaxID=1440133 RepID=A0A9P6JHH0_9FUNG|nr:hypothetical protein BGZ65_005524 [Modicella reniformis]